MKYKPALNKSLSPWYWVPSLYFAQGIPYVAVMIIAVLMYKQMGLSNTDVALYTSWLNLPWVIKPLWSPFIDLLKTKRWWIVTMQLVIGAGLAAVAFSIPTSFFVQATLAAFWLLAFSSATHDIAADGFYMLALDSHEQAFFVGIRSTFYRIATIAGQGLLVMFVGVLLNMTKDLTFAWSVAFFILTGIFLALFVYHFFVLPVPDTDKSNRSVNTSSIFKDFIGTFISFFKKKQALAGILFMLLYRFPEAQLTKLVIPFLVDPRESGGLGLTTVEIGFAYGTVGTIGLVLGGILGGIAAATGGLKKWLWPMALAITLPDVVFIYLSMALPESLLIVNVCVFIEQFGYGFGFAAYMLFLIYYSDGEYKTAHYAICTAFMAMGLMLPGMISGWLQEHLGYVNFFWWVMGCCIVTLLVTSFLKIDPDFGKKSKKEQAD
ncbi:MAG: Anhydromuropeptide permease [Parabacteroides sp.]|jgi:hypothetical protein